MVIKIIIIVSIIDIIFISEDKGQIREGPGRNQGGTRNRLRREQGKIRNQGQIRDQGQTKDGPGMD